MLKFIVNQIAMSVFGIMMSFTAKVIGDTWLVAFGAFALLFYYFILWTFLWEDGAKDGIKVSGGRMKKNSFLGLSYCSVAALPSALFALLLVIFNLTLDAASNAVGLMNIVVKVFTFGMYNAIDSYFASFGGWFASASSIGITYLCYGFVTLVVCHFAYICGLNQLKLTNKK